MALGLLLVLGKKKRLKLKRKWAKGWLLKRSQFSHTNLLEELRLEPDDWFNYLRMDEGTYSQLLQAVTPHIKRQDTVLREAITPHERLTATLRFLCTGRNYEDLKFSAIISAQSLGKIIPEACLAIYKALSGEYMKFPNSKEEFTKIAEEYEKRWHFPNCLGAVDGKYIAISPPSNSGSYYWNYKNFNSIVLLGIANSNYELILADIGTNGRMSAGGVIGSTTFYQTLKKKGLEIPSKRKPNNGNDELEYVFIGDEAFTLRHDFLKPFNQRELNHDRAIFNYRLSRARRVIENVFGIMASRFRVLHTTINVSVDRAEIIVMACCILHNFLRRNCNSSYTSAELFDVEDIENGEVVLGQRSDSRTLVKLQCGRNRNYGNYSKEVRNNFVEYFNGAGKVEW